MNRTNTFVNNLKIMVAILGIMWIVFVISLIIPSINTWGIIPRSVRGLIGIICSPFLHGGYYHILENSIALFILGMLQLSIEREKFFAVNGQIILLSGFGTWLIGSAHSIHIGASGLIYGLIGYLLFLCLFKKSFKTIIVSIIILAIYIIDHQVLRDMLPGRPHMSWEGHLTGFISGFLIAWSYSRINRK